MRAFHLVCNFYKRSFPGKRGSVLSVLLGPKAGKSGLLPSSFCMKSASISLNQDSIGDVGGDRVESSCIVDDDYSRRRLHHEFKRHVRFKDSAPTSPLFSQPLDFLAAINLSLLKGLNISSFASR